MVLKPETVASIQLFNWVRSMPDVEPYVFHIANERKCTPFEGRILKRMGVSRGVSDYMIAIPSGPYHGMFLELKVGSNKPSEEQQKFLDDMTAKGYMAVCVWGYEAAKIAIETYLKMRNQNAFLATYSGHPIC